MSFAEEIESIRTDARVREAEAAVRAVWPMRHRAPMFADALRIRLDRLQRLWLALLAGR